MQSDQILGIFDALLLAFGLYLLFRAVQMKRTGDVPRLLLAEEEAKKIGNKPGFIAEIYGKLMFFAAVTACYGAFSLVDDLIVEIPLVQILGMIIFLTTMLWFFRSLHQAKMKYL